MRLIRQTAGVYVTDDPFQSYCITRELGHFRCGLPHPVKDGTYHEGGEAHAYHFWQLAVLRGGFYVPLDYGTRLSEMETALEERTAWRRAAS